MKRDLSLFLEDILESITLIEKYTKKMKQPDLEKNREVQDAVGQKNRDYWRSSEKYSVCLQK